MSTIPILWKEDEIQVDYDFFPPCRGRRDTLCGKRGAGPQLEPDEPAYVEVNEVRRLGQEVDLSASERQAIADEVLALLSEKQQRID